ncbi:hypothetical protein D3C78_1836650 [compost metagenome]
MVTVTVIVPVAGVAVVAVITVIVAVVIVVVATGRGQHGGDYGKAGEVFQHCGSFIRTAEGS